MATLNLISKKTGLSTATISRILNNDSSLAVKESTRRKVLEASDELGYQIKSKKPKTSKQLFTAVFSYSENLELNDPYYLSIRMAIEQECAKLNISLDKIFDFDTDSTLSNDCILAIGAFSPSQLEILKQKNTIFIDSNHFPEFDSIIPDLPTISKAILDYFLEQGYTKIGYIGGRDIDNVPDEREVFFLQYMKSLGLFEDDFFQIGQFTNQSGYEMAKDLLSKDKLPQAIFTGNDSIAIGVLKAFNENNISIPDQIAIVGINDIPAASFTYPSLSTVKIPADLIGSQAVRLLKDKISSKRKSSIKVYVPFTMVLRDTTK